MKTFAFDIAFLGLLLAVAPAPAAVVTETVTYEQGGTKFKGFLAYDDAATGKRPGVLVVHEWWGLNDYAKSRARQLAEMGYVAFAADMYGDGVTAKDRKEAGALSSRVKSGNLLRPRARAAFEVLAKSERVDPKRIAAIGYCFGGTTALELAYSGADLRGIVSFHGSLTLPKSGDRPRTKFLVLHGADDPFVSDKVVSGWDAAMRAGHYDWQLVKYSGAVHAFTNPAAGNDNSQGAAYNEAAARRSWEHMKAFFAEIFEESKPREP